MTITVKQYGLLSGSGTLASIVDGDPLIGWAPLADNLATYTSNFLDTLGAPNAAGSFAGFEFDFGTPVRVPLFLFQTESEATLIKGMLIASENPATGVSDMVQAGDTLLGIYTTEQINSNTVQETAARHQEIITRYIRLCFRSGDETTSPDTSDPGYLPPTVGTQFDTPGASGVFVVPEYTNYFVIEGWGGGASGDIASMSMAGTASTCSTYSLIANGGSASTITHPNSNGTPAAGGTASGGNTANITGGAGGLPTAHSGFGQSGAGGDSPNGGVGGPPVYISVFVFGTFWGNDGAAPGGGGGGYVVFYPGASGIYFKYPGGGAGGYFKHAFVRGTAGAPEPEDEIAYTVGAGGVSTHGGGDGAPGRIKFSYG
jgi:hypothetical protein